MASRSRRKALREAASVRIVPIETVATVGTESGTEARTSNERRGSKCNVVCRAQAPLGPSALQLLEISAQVEAAECQVRQPARRHTSVLTWPALLSHIPSCGLRRDRSLEETPAQTVISEVQPGRFFHPASERAAAEPSQIKSSRVGLARSLELSGLSSVHRPARPVACAYPCAGGAEVR